MKQYNNDFLDNIYIEKKLKNELTLSAMELLSVFRPKVNRTLFLMKYMYPSQGMIKERMKVLGIRNIITMHEFGLYVFIMDKYLAIVNIKSQPNNMILNSNEFSFKFMENNIDFDIGYISYDFISKIDYEIIPGNEALKYVYQYEYFLKDKYYLPIQIHLINKILQLNLCKIDCVFFKWINDNSLENTFELINYLVQKGKSKENYLREKERIEKIENKNKELTSVNCSNDTNLQNEIIRLVHEFEGIDFNELIKKLALSEFQYNDRDIYIRAIQKLLIMKKVKQIGNSYYPYIEYIE